MMERKNPKINPKQKWADLCLWIAFLLPPMAWFGHLNVGYFWSAYACSDAWLWTLHAYAALAFGLSLAGLGCGWHNWRFYSAQESTRRGTLFASGLALALAVIYAMCVIANEVTILMLEFCR